LHNAGSISKHPINIVGFPLYSTVLKPDGFINRNNADQPVKKGLL